MAKSQPGLGFSTRRDEQRPSPYPPWIMALKDPRERAAAMRDFDAARDGFQPLVPPKEDRTQRAYREGDQRRRRGRNDGPDTTNLPFNNPDPRNRWDK